MNKLSDYTVISEFDAFIRRPEPMISGMKANLFCANGISADASLIFGRTEYQDALVDVSLCQGETEIGGFQGYVRRPKPKISGMVVVFYAENGEMADAITAMSLSKYLDIETSVIVRLLNMPNGNEANKKKSGPYGHIAQKLWRSSFFRTPKVWVAIGTDTDYLDWLRDQGCCIGGSHDGDVVAAHVRRVALGAGTGIKPKYSAVPMCNHHHTIQHQLGESAVGGKRFLDKQRIKYLQAWCWETIAKDLGYEGVSYIPPQEVVNWAEDEGVSCHLPSGYLYSD